MSEKISFPLDIYDRVLGLQDWHSGYWEDDNNQTLEEAQKGLNSLVLKCIPKSPCRILYLGFGSSALARQLARGGHEVIIAAPAEDAAPGRNDGFQDNISLVQSDFFASADEHRHESKSFQVIILHDSLIHHAQSEDLCRKARFLLKEKGRVVLCDEMLFDPSLEDETAFLLRKDLVTEFFENGFYIKKEMDITRNVFRTCDFFISRLEAHAVKHSGPGDSGSDKDVQKLLDFWKCRKGRYASKQSCYLLLHLVMGDIFIRPYKSGDEQKILPEFNKVFATDRTMDQWTWKYRHNPYGRTKIALAVDQEDRIAGHFSSYPLRFCSNLPDYQTFLSCQAGDTMTSPAFRNVGLGPTSVLSRTAFYYYDKFCQDNYPFIYGFNTGNIRKFGERYLEYKYNAEVGYYVLDRFSRKRSAWYFWKKRTIDGIRIRKIMEPGDEFNTFFSRVRQQYALLVCRDAQYLKWRYFEAPGIDYQCFGVYVRGSMVGWLIVKKKDQAMIIGDSLFDFRYLNSLKYMLEYLFSKHPDISQMVAWSSSVPEWWPGTLSNSGFVREKEPDSLAPCFKVFDPFFSADFFQDNFYYTMGDSDLF